MFDMARSILLDEIRSYLKVTGCSTVSGSDVAELRRLPGPAEEVVLVPMKRGCQAARPGRAQFLNGPPRLRPRLRKQLGGLPPVNQHG